MMDDESSNRYDPQASHWHLDKRIPIATLLMIITLTLTGVMYITQIQTDIALLRQQQLAMIDRMNRQDQVNTQYLNRIERKLDQIEQVLRQRNNPR